MSLLRFKLSAFVLIALLAAPGAMALPRVLIIGDSVHRQSMGPLEKMFQGKAVIAHAQASPIHNTTTMLEALETMLGESKWDVIYFNCGLGDLIHRVPDLKSFRVMPIHEGGVKATSPDNYEANLREIVKRLKATGAKLIWANTTPIRASTSNVFELGSEVTYNDLAAKVMAENEVPISDMYNHVRDVIDMDKPAGHGADPFNFDRKPIYWPAAQSIGKALNIAVEKPEGYDAPAPRRR